MEKRENIIASLTSSIHFLNNRKVKLEIDLKGIKEEIQIKQKKLDIISIKGME